MKNKNEAGQALIFYCCGAGRPDGFLAGLAIDMGVMRHDKRSSKLPRMRSHRGASTCHSGA